MAPPKRTHTGTPSFVRFTPQQIIDNAAADADNISHALQSQDLNYYGPENAAHLKKVKITAKDITERANDPARIARMNRAHDLYDRVVLNPVDLNAELQEDHPEVEPYLVENERLTKRMAHNFIDPDRSPETNYLRLMRDPAHNISELVARLQACDISGLFHPDADRYLDTMENGGAQLALMSAQLVTLLGQSGLYADKAGHSPEAGVAPDWPLKDILLQSPAHPNGLTPEQLDWLLENEELLMSISGAGSRLMDEATPFSLIVGDDPALKGVLVGYTDSGIKVNGAWIDCNDNGFFGAKQKDNYFGGVSNSIRYGNYYAESINTYAPSQAFLQALNKNPEIIQNGWLDGDFTAYGKDGKRLDKDTAVKNYAADKNSVEFRLNALGKKREPMRRQEQANAQKMLQQAEQMETRLNEIYGSSFNASPEFNALAKSIRDFKKIAEYEAGAHRPSMDRLSRELQKVQEKANTYEQAKEAKKDTFRGRYNELRQKRVDFARSIAAIPDPLATKHALQELDKQVQQKQKNIETALEELGSDLKHSDQFARDAIKTELAELLTLKTFAHQIETDGEHMKPTTRQALTDPKAVAEQAKQFMTTQTFKDMVSGLDKPLPAGAPNTPDAKREQLRGALDEIGVAKSAGGLYRTDGVRKMFDNFTANFKKEVRQKQQSRERTVPQTTKSRNKEKGGAQRD